MKEWSIIVEERKNTVLDRHVFSLFLKRKSRWFWDLPMAQNVQMYDILPMLVSNLKEQDQVCYLFFSVDTLPGEMCDSIVSVNNVNKALSLASEYLTIYRKDPKNIVMGYKDGVETRLLVLKENAIANIAKIVKLISCRDCIFYLIFDSEANKDTLCKKLKSFDNNNALKPENVFTLSSRIIGYSLINWTSQILIYSTRFDLQQIKNIILNFADLI